LYRLILPEMPGETLPATARAISLLLASNPAIQDVHPGVLHQLLEFSYRYTHQVLSDSLVYSEHAGRAGKLELEDVMLAIQARVGWELGGRVPKEVQLSDSGLCQSSSRMCSSLYHLQPKQTRRLFRPFRKSLESGSHLRKIVLQL
jgi:hypothetical protein